MIVIPIVISSLKVRWSCRSRERKQVGKLGVKTILYFEIITTFAIVIGVLVANIFHPGQGVDIHSAQKSDISQYVETSEQQEGKSVAETFLHIVPTNFFQSIVEGDMLAIIFFTVLFALGVAAIGERGKPVVQIL